MLECVITSSVLILALSALRRVLRGRINPRLMYGLWAVGGPAPAVTLLSL